MLHRLRRSLPEYDTGTDQRIHIHPATMAMIKDHIRVFQPERWYFLDEYHLVNPVECFNGRPICYDDGVPEDEFVVLSQDEARRVWECGRYGWMP